MNSFTSFERRASLERTPTQRIAFVQACWHKEIVDQCKTGFSDVMKSEGYPLDSIEFHEVPGAFELPLYAKRLAQTGNYSGVVAAGLVVDGGIYRHEFVASTVIDALMHVQLQTGMPIFSAVLTPHHFHGGAEHVEFFRNHFVLKGAEAAHACIATIGKLEAIGASSRQRPDRNVDDAARGRNT